MHRKECKNSMGEPIVQLSSWIASLLQLITIQDHKSRNNHKSSHPLCARCIATFFSSACCGGVTTKTNENAKSKLSTKITMGLLMQFFPAGPAGGSATPDRCELLCQGTIRQHLDLVEMRVMANPAWNSDVAPVPKIFPACSLLTFNICAVHAHKYFKALASHHRLALHLNICGE